jgi:transcriptional regulator
MSTSPFAPRSDADILRLVETQPLAWVVARGDANLQATPLPLRPVVDAEGRIVELLGHFARRNPQVEMLRAQPQALLLFLGAQAYISPSWMQDRTQAPTWNYASAQFLTEITLFDAPDQIEALLADLIGTMERGRPKGWNHTEMGPRYASLSRGIVGFRARVLQVQAKFKLGQDEREDVFGDITAALEREGAHELLAWMRMFDAR